MERLEVGSLGTVMQGSGTGHEDLLSAADDGGFDYRWFLVEEMPNCDEGLVLCEGDVFGTLRGPSEWNVVPKGRSGLAGDGVIVIRLASECPVPPAFVASFLRSATRREPVGSEADLRALMVPIPALNRDELERLMAGLTSVRNKLRAVQGEIEVQEWRVWSARSAQDLATNLRELAFHAAATSSSAARLSETDPLLGLDQLPFPAAMHYRSAITALDAREEYDAVLRFGSYLGVLLGAIALSWAYRNDRVDLTEDWRRAAYQGGVSYGHWLTVARVVGEVLSARGEYVTLKDLLQPGRGSLQESILALHEERNLTAHGAGPRHDSEVRSRLLQIWPIARRARFAAARLRDHPLVVVERSNVRRRPHESSLDEEFDLLVDVAMGDHPAFIKQELSARSPLPPGAVCLLVGDRLLNLDPYVVSFDCARCRRRELFHVDRVTAIGARYRSLETNHEILDEERVADIPKP